MPGTRVATRELPEDLAHLKRKDLTLPYGRFARVYDALSAEPVYRVGRERAIPALGLKEGSRALDIGCGTGLNFPLLLSTVGRHGHVVGVDQSHQMLKIARQKTIDAPPGSVSEQSCSPTHCHS